MKIKVLRALIAGLLGFYMPFLTGQSIKECTVQGKVIDENGKAVPFATVYMDKTNYGLTTNDKGFYSIKVPSGTYTFVVSAIGFVKNETNLVLKKGQQKHIDVKLNSDVTDIDEVQVVGKSHAQKLREGSYSLNVIEMNKYQNSTTDINQSLKKTSGITIRENGGMGSDFSFKINGLDAKVFIDGVPMENFGSSMTINNIPVNLVERVEVYKGVVPAYLGTDALGGAVNIITKRKNNRFLDFSYGYGSFNTHQASLNGSYTELKTGLTIKLNSFFNYSDNNYKMYSDSTYNIILEKAKNGKYVYMDNAERFHDMYYSAMGKMEVGFEDKPWADRLLFGLLYSGNKQQAQLGSTVNSVKGGEWSENRFIMPSLHYRKDSFFVDNLYADWYSGYSRSTTNVRDTAQHIYDWTGKWASTGSTIDEVHNKYVYKTFTNRVNLNYDLNSKQTQSLNLNYNYDSNKRDYYDLIEDEQTNLPAKLSRHIAGLAWQSSFLHKRLISILSFKYYGMNANNTVDERKFNSDGSLASGSINTYQKFFNYPSGSLALRYLFVKDFGIKASYEKAYSLPSMLALFGDGQNYLANFDLEPEQSKNINVGIFYNQFLWRNHFINIDMSCFYRDASNYINVKIVENGGSNSSDAYQYYNSPGVLLYGAEAELKYGYKDMLSVSLNGSYDRALNNWKYTDDSDSQVSITYKEQLPNRPWIYGNADISLGKYNLLGKDTRLELSYSYQYIHWFYLSWASLGTKSSKNFVPTQTVHNAILSYSWKRDRYSLSCEARNFTNELCYDNFRLQKPGRAFYLKFRISIL